MNQNSLPPCIVALALVYAICFVIKIDAGGKGKGNKQGHIIIQNEVKDRNPPVPIYIPIPIPMPMGPPGGGKPYNGHHHHQQQQSGDGDSEVKKIYLLQPMPRVQPAPQLKGGFIGPVQTHIHVPAPVVQQHAGKSHHGGHHARPNVGGFNEGHEEGTKTSQGSASSGHHHHHSDMKILPIVVIPPIAPIHMPHSQHDKKGSEHQESRTYGGSVGGITYRKAFGPRGKLRPSKFEQSSDAMDQFGFAASRARSSRNRNEDYGDDYEMSPPWSRYNQQHQSSARQAPTSSSSSRRWPSGISASARRRMILAADEHHNSNQRSAGSIRDIIDQQRQVVFDDEISNIGESSRQAPECCHEPRRSRYQAADSNIPADAGPLYYDRDLQPTDEQESNPTLFGKYDPIVGRRKYLDESDPLEDDEWAFDSIKSVTHVNSPTNATSTATNTTITSSKSQ